MAQELVLGAEVTDKFSKPLKDLIARMKDIKPSAGLRDTAKQFDELRSKVEAATKAVSGGLGGLASGAGLSGLSVGALSAAGAMGALAASVKSFADNTVAMKNFSDTTGVASQKLKELKAVASGLGINPDTIASGLAYSASNADQMRRGQGNFSALANLKGGASIANDLKNTKSNDEVIEKELNYLARQKSAEGRRTLSQMFFGTEDFSAFGAAGPAALANSRAAARASISTQSAEDDARAKAFLDATSRVEASMEKIKNAVGSSLAPALTELADDLNKFADAHFGEIRGFFGDVGKALTDVDWKGDSQAVVLFVSKIKEAIEFMQRLSGNTGPVAADRDSAKDRQYFQQKTGTWLDQLPKSWFHLDLQKGSLVDRLINGGPAPFVQPQHPHTTTPTPGTRPDNRGVRDTFMGADPIAYRPGLSPGAVGARDAIQTIAAGVTKGMQDFAQSLQGGAAGPDGAGGGGGGLINASWNPNAGGRIRMGGGGQGGTYDVSSITGVTAKGNFAKNQDEAYKAARAAGLDHDSALAWVANVSGESLRDPGNTSGDGGTAQGIVQWHHPRAAEIKRRFGMWPAQMSVTDQTKAALDEMKRSYPEAWKVLNDPKATREQKVDALVRHYEIPGNPGKSYRERIAFLKGLINRMKDQADAAADRPPAPSLSAKAAKQAADGGRGPHGKVSIEITSKNHPVKAKTDDSPIFQELKINRGQRMEI